ncbi:MAG TPA: hypothetical protein VHW47_07795, partial [Acidimicrobiales bacterium]|nr:hypothetical protein [Acidimicrobiales bacterium]
MLPRSLRYTFATSPLPVPVAADLGLPPGTVAGQLDRSIWSGVDRLSGRVVEFLLGLAGCRAARDLRIMVDPWPPEVRPDDVRWPTRLDRALQRGDLLAVERLERLTYGQLLAIPAAGRKSALELGVILDGLVPPPARPLGPAALAELAAAGRQRWADRIGSGDPRFRDVLPPHPGRLGPMLATAVGDPRGRLARTLAHGLPAIAARVDEVAADPLDVAVTRLVRAFGISERDLAIGLARTDRRTGRRRKLQEIGDQFSVTKERTRQVADRVAEQLRLAYLPQVERASRVL